MWHLTCDMRHLTCHKWYVTCETCFCFMAKSSSKVTKSAKNFYYKKLLQSVQKCRKMSKRQDFIVLVLLKNPLYRRHWQSQCVGIIAPIFKKKSLGEKRRRTKSCFPYQVSHVTCHLSPDSCRQQPHPETIPLLAPSFYKVGWFTKTYYKIKKYFKPKYQSTFKRRCS